METLQIAVENEHVKMATELFLDNYKDAVVQFINNVLKNEVGASDAFVEKTSDGIKIYQTAPDKGFVLAKVGEEVQVTRYTSLSTDDKYVVFDGTKLALFLKTEAGKPDIKVGMFLNLNEVIQQFDSESVKLAIDTIKSGIKNALIDQKKAEKKAKKGQKQSIKA